MKKKILSMILAGAFVIGTLAACQTTTPEQPAGSGTTQGGAAQGGAAQGGAAQGGAAQGGTTVQPDPPAAGVLGRGINVVTQNEPPSVAPGQHNAVAGSYMNAMHYSALFRLDAATMAPIPNLVASYVAVSDTVFEFTLHEGVQFHDGTILTAHDVIASWEFVRQFPFGSASRESIVHFEALDDLTVRVDTEIPNALFFTDLAHQSNHIMPRHLIESGNDFETNVVGTGPFVFQEWRSGDSIHSTAFENYFDEDRAARVEYVTWRIVPEATTRTIMMETNEADYNVYVGFSDIQRLQDASNVVMETYTGTSHSVLLMNNDLPMFQDYRVRRALGMAVNQESVILVGMEGHAIPARGNVPNIFPGFDPDLGAYEFDPQGALALLAEAGVDPSTISFSMIASNEERRRMGEVMQAYFAAIGVTATIDMNDLATTLERTQQGNYETGFGGFSSATFLGYVRGVLHSSQAIPGGSNRSNFRNDEMDEWITLGLATVDASQRPAIYQEIARIANTYTPHIPTHMAMNARAWNSNLVVPELCPTGALNLNVMFWAE